VLLITTDQQRYDTLGVTGNPHIRTPNLDSLAARGTLFDRAYIQNPVCVPSRASIQTGRYVHQHGVEYMENEVEQTPGLPPWETTFMERLRQNGYTTAAFGKIHMLPPKGLDEMQLTLGKGARWTEAEGSPLGPAQLGPIYAEWLDRKRPGAYESIYAQRRLPEYRDQATAIVNTLSAEEYVDYWSAENTRAYLERDDVGTAEKPFFAWCGFCGPHGPFDPPEPYASLYDPSQIPLPPLLHSRQRGALPGDYESRFDRPDGEQLIRKIVAYYWGMMTFIDDKVGEIMEVLTRRGLWNNTLVIFTTDHGEMLGDFGRLGKGTFIESVIQAPCILVPPDSKSTEQTQPRRVGSLVELIDLAPTILDYAGLPQSEALPGTSLRQYLQPVPDPSRASSSEKESVLCEYVSNDQQLRRKCLRTERYKYIFSGTDQPVEFYDLEEDPQELVNVASDPAYLAEVHRHSELLLHRLMMSEQNAWNGDLITRTPPTKDSFGRPVASTA
jgi:arylsulfatase A-like enzyme